MRQQTASNQNVVAAGDSMQSGWIPAPAAILDEIEIPAEADDAEKAQEVIDASYCLSEEADEAERTEELIAVERPVLPAEAEEAEKVDALLARPPIVIGDELQH